MSDSRTTPDTGPLLQVEEARVVFQTASNRDGVVAVDDVSLRLDRGRTLGLVGSSGCGKTSLARAIMHLVPLTSGRIRLMGTDLSSLSRSELRTRRRQFQMVFQDPGGSLNARMRVVDLVSEPLLVHGLARGAELNARATACLGRVGIPEEAVNRYPPQFSGGQRQRIAIARAIITEPALLVCDEPTSALDVSVQTQVLELLRKLQREGNLAMLFITHDMGVVRQMCDDVMVMDGGKVIESGPVAQVLDAPSHAVTQALIEAALAGTRI